jgi:DNA adenine methylase
MRPILRWAGSKKYLAEYLTPRFPENYERYVEPFCGSASLFFINEPKKALLADINKELINALSAVKKDPSEVGIICQGLPTDSESYYLIRSWKPNELNELERAARFIYLNRLCFNGLYRTNKKGDFNVPYSGKRTPNMITLHELQDAARTLKNTNIKCWDYKKTLEKTQQGDFAYIDPPYVSVEAKRFSEYAPNSFSTNELNELYEMLSAIDSKGVRFMLSYADCAEMKKFSKRWNSEKVEVRRNIAGFTDFRKKALEVVIKNY